MSPAIIAKLPPGVLVEALPDGRVVLRPARRHDVDVVDQQTQDSVTGLAPSGGAVWVERAETAYAIQ